MAKKDRISDKHFKILTPVFNTIFSKCRKTCFVENRYLKPLQITSYVFLSLLFGFGLLVYRVYNTTYITFIHCRYTMQITGGKCCYFYERSTNVVEICAKFCQNVRWEELFTRISYRNYLIYTRECVLYVCI